MHIKHIILALPEQESTSVRNRKSYPANWPELARACKDRAGWKCEHCKVKHRAWRKSKRTGRRYRVYLQAAHVNHLERGQDDAELICLCFTCHARYDYQHDQRLKAIRLECLRHRKAIPEARRRINARQRAAMLIAIL